MEPSTLHPGDQFVLELPGLQALIDRLHSAGYEVVGPTIANGAIIFDKISSLDDLPVGWTDEQSPGRYRLIKRQDRALFGYASGPFSWKTFLRPTHRTLFQVQRGQDSVHFAPVPADAPRYAFLGVRPCDLAAIRIQDRVLIDGPQPDASYRDRRNQAFIVCVNCSDPAANCFCVSMGIGPHAEPPYDLRITEVLEKRRHFFVVDAGSQAGADIAPSLPSAPAEPEHLQAADAVTRRAASRITKTLPSKGLREGLLRGYEHPQWDQVAQRCLTCGNCTSVCPTCFCVTVDDSTDLVGEKAERLQRMDSCFSLEFSYIFGGSVRASAASRYRQWLMHKLATWYDQFGTPGCVGCGRCITWCPVGIDITEEARAVLGHAASVKEKDRGNTETHP